jgi:hypothetical protein
MKIDFVKTLEASSPYTPGRIYFEESTSLIKVATANNQYRVFGGVRSADYDATTQTLTIQNGNGDEVYLDMSEYVKQDSIIYNGNAKIFYGTCSSGGSDTAKVVACEDFTSSELVKGALIFVTFDATNSAAAADILLNVNNTGAKHITKLYNTTANPNLNAAGELKANKTYLFGYDGTNWVCLTLDYNTSYSSMSEAEATAGTSTSNRVITPARLKGAITYWMTQNQADWDSSDNTSPSYILNKPTIPSTLDQIADGSTRKLSDYLPLAGGYMSSIDSSIFFGQDGYGFTKISYGGITVRNGGYFDGNQIEMKDPNADGGVGGIYVTEYNLHGYFKNYDYTFPLKSGTIALASDIPTDSSVSGWGYLKANDVSTKVDKSNAVSSLSLGMNSSTYTITLSGAMADGSTFTVGDPIDLPLETMVVDGSYNSSTKKVSLGLKNGSSVEFSVADLVAGLQSEITSSNKLSADLIQDGTTNKVVTATDKNNWNSLVSNVQADWNATTGLGVILNKPTIPAAVTESTVSGWGFTKNAGTLTGVKFNNTNATINGTVAEITATIPSTLDQIADGSTRKLSNYVPIAGCTLDEDVPITFTDSRGESRSEIYYNAIEIENDSDQFYISINCGGPDITITAHEESTIYGNKSISLYEGTNFYQQLLQEKSGTIALTSDIPAAVTESTVAGWGFTKNTGTLSSHADHKLLIGSASATAASSNTITYVESLTGTATATHGDLTVTPTLKTITIPSAVTESTVSGWGFTKNAAPGTLKTSNTTAQTASASESLSGTINLHKVAKTGTYSDLIGTPTIPTVNNGTLTIQKNGTNVNTFTANSSSNVTANIQVNELPTVTASDNGKILRVVSGAWALVTPVSIYTGTGQPDNLLGNNGDIYIQTQ